MTTELRNQVLLEGTALGSPVWSHENHGTSFYRLFLEVRRLSGQADRLPVLLPEELCSQLEAGQTYRITGQLRSFNNRSGIGNRLVLSVYAREAVPSDGPPCNLVQLSGHLCKPPILRRTPLGRSICDLMLAVPRRYGRADYIPVIAWGQLALQASRLTVGDPLTLDGRFQSRAYQKVTDFAVEDRIAYEISVMRLPDSLCPVEAAAQC